MILKNALIMPMDKHLGYDKKFIGEVEIKGDEIVYVGEIRTNTKCDVDLSGKVLLPGFKNAHTHSPMTFLRSFAEDVPLNEWLNLKVFPAEAKLNDEMIYWYNKLAIIEYVSNGITADFDMYISPKPVIDSSIECGFRNVQCGSLNNFTLSEELLEEFYLKYNDYHPLISYQLGVHAEYTCSYKLLEKVSDLANKYKAPVYLHAHETIKEVLECKKRYNKTPTKLLDEMGMYNYGGGGFHCVHMEEEDVDIYKKRGLYIVTNPSSNAKLASGIAPIKKYLDRGIEVAIGTDGAASNNALDIFREMYLCAVLAKLKENDSVAISALEVLKMATTAGAHAMGIPECDSIAVGKKADLTAIDYNKANMRPHNDIVSNIIYSANPTNVAMTMVAGKILFDRLKGFDNYNIGIDIEEVYKRCEEYKERIF